jgi:hypothetical protein
VAQLGVRAALPAEVLEDDIKEITADGNLLELGSRSHAGCP